MPTDRPSPTSPADRGEEVQLVRDVLVVGYMAYPAIYVPIYMSQASLVPPSPPLVIAIPFGGPGSNTVKF